MATLTTAETIERYGGDPDVAIFYSKGTNLRLIRRPTVRVLTAVGTQRLEQEGIRYEFAPAGVLVVRRGQDVLPDGPGGEEQDAIAWLDSHNSLNEYFWREGREPNRALPLERDFLRDVQRALVARDVDALRGLLAAEKAKHHRQVLVEAAQSAIQALAETEPDAAGEAPVSPLDGLDREELVARAEALELFVPDAATDDQIRAALLLATPPE